MTAESISVVVVDDHPLFRRGIVELVNETEDMNVIAQHDSATELFEQLDEQSADILLLDLQMPEKSGLQVLKQIRQKDDKLKIIIISACTEQEKILEAISHGANGFLQKNTSPDEILSQIRSVISGNVALNANAVTSLASHLRNSQKQASSQLDETLEQMTDREQETLRHIANGLTNKMIARELGISDGTVKVYVKSLLRKLNLHSRIKLAAWAHKNLSEEFLERE